MAALTKDRNTRTKAHTASRTGRRGVAANAIIFKGALLALNAAGWLVAVTDAAAIRIVGISEENINATGAANGAKLCTYITALEVELENAGGAIVQANLGRGCYAADDQSVTTKAVSVNKVFLGVVTEFTAAKVWVMIDDSVLGVLGDENISNTIYSAVSPAVSTPGVPVLIAIDLPDAATTTYSYLVPEKIEIIDVWNIKDVAGAANTIQVNNGADVAITNAMAAAVDKTLTRAGTIDKATRTLAAGATLKVVATRAAGSMAAQLFIAAIKRA